MENSSWLDKVINEGVIGIMNEDNKANPELCLEKKHGRIGHVLKHYRLCMKLLKAE